MIPVDEKEFGKLRINKKIVGDIKKPKAPPVKEIDENTKATLALAQSIKQLAERKDPIPEKQDLTPLLDMITKIQETQKDIIAALLKEPSKKKWDFTVKHSDGRTTKIHAVEGKG